MAKRRKHPNPSASSAAAASAINKALAKLPRLNDKELAEQNLILGFLARYPELNIGQKRKAQDSIKRLLLDFDRPLNGSIRLALATELFDSQTIKLVAVRRRERKDHLIAVDIARETLAGTKWEAAVKDAMIRYRVSRPTVTRAWKEHRRFARSFVKLGWGRLVSNSDL